MSSKTILSGILCGALFGVAFQKSKVYQPIVIQRQMEFSNWIMVKFFFSAVATSTLALLFLEKKGYMKRSTKPKSSLLGINYLDAIVGGGLLGVGMTITGSCPGTVWAQLGAQVAMAPYTFLGAFIGATVYGSFEPYISKYLKLQRKETGDTLDKKLGISFSTLSITTAAVMYSAVLIVEKFFPWTDDLESLGYSVNGFSPFDPNGHWHPLFSGIILGLLQIPAGILAGSHLGTSTSYCSFIGQGLGYVKSSVGSYFQKCSGKTFQKAMVISIILGSMGSYLMADKAPTSIVEPEYSPVKYVLGGICLLFGARLANGCPSGHGITGMSQFNIGSIFGVMSMFAGGILTRYLTTN